MRSLKKNLMVMPTGLDIIQADVSQTTDMDYQHIITIEPGKRSRKPCIRGMRVTVYNILEYLAGGMSESEILEDFSALTSEDIKACLAFAADCDQYVNSRNGNPKNQTIHP